MYLQLPLLQSYPHPGRKFSFLPADNWRILADKSGHALMKLDDLTGVTKLYCARIYNGDTCAKALFMDPLLSGKSNPFLCLGVYEPKQPCDIVREAYNLSRFKAKH